MINIGPTKGYSLVYVKMQKLMGSSTGTELLNQHIICVTREESCILMP